MRAGRRAATLFGVVTAVVIAAAACTPIVNAPGGGGAITTGTYRIGPSTPAGMGQPGSENNASQSNVPRPAGAVGIKSMNFDLVDANGTPIPRDMAHLHHVLLMNPAHTDVLCPGRSERFAGAGAERTPPALRDPYAYLVGQSDTWNALWHIMNLSNAPMTVYIQYKVGYQPGANATNTRNVTPFFMDVTGCGGSEYNVPGNGGPGSEYLKAKTWNAPFGGVAVYAGGHLHGGGMDITLHDDTFGNQCVMTATYAGGGGGMAMNFPQSINPCAMHNLVVKGKPYTVTARYDNSQPYMAVMGIVLAYVWQGVQ